MTERLDRSRLMALDSFTRAFTLVGAYMGFFALLEQGINNAIGAILDVDPVKLAIITRNMTFYEKIQTLRSLVRSYVLDTEKVKEFDKLAMDAQRISETRNIVAHTAFQASKETDGVEFFKIDAKKQLTIGQMDWTIDDFLNAIEHIISTDNAIRLIKNRMLLQDVAKAIVTSAPSNPTNGLMASNINHTM